MRRRKDARKYGVEASISSVLFILLFFVMIVQILGRTPLVAGPVWTEELARWIWVWMALIGIAAVEAKNAHLRMGFLMALLPQGVQRIWAIIVDLVYIVLVGHLVWIAYKSVLRTWNNEAVTLPTTDAALYASAAVATLLIFHRIGRRLFGALASNTQAGAS